ncbi:MULTISPECIES: GNAT family N-acetyltransferase [Citrobacter]|uniref:GNAT family N-acetyltransferase n=1 Tax=Citrobacter TaxID=544 RepID=UPI000B8E93F9|nr:MULTISPECIES: GNAT family N-acetyltransferase [Citrobacter]EGT5654424.1 GNAT family N-acetyltransferase [Citrobacter braakii]MBA8129308.1 GNAT family N-acetyltransferase [Citrobacter sp. RHBSTW-00013]
MDNGIRFFLTNAIEHDAGLLCNVLKKFKRIDDYITKLLTSAQVLAIYESNKIIGVICFYCNDINSLTAYISLIVVDVDSKQKGIGGDLISSAILISKRKGFKFCRLEVNKDNIAAISFYGKNEFSVISEHADAFIMQKNI